MPLVRLAPFLAQSATGRQTIVQTAHQADNSIQGPIPVIVWMDIIKLGQLRVSCVVMCSVLA